MFFKNRKKETQQVEPQITDRFADMEKELMESNPEREAEVIRNTNKYVPSGVKPDAFPRRANENIDDLDDNFSGRNDKNRLDDGDYVPSFASQNSQRQSPTSNRSTESPSVFSSNRAPNNFTRQIHGQDEDVQKTQLMKRPTPAGYVPPQREIPKHQELEENSFDRRYEQEDRRGVTSSGMNYSSHQLHRPSFEEPVQKQARGYFVSATLNEADFSKFLKGDKSVLKVFPVLAENPEQAAKLIEMKNMVPVEIYEYSFFKAQVDRMEALARENDIILINK